MKYAYSQKWVCSHKNFSVEVFHWKPDLHGAQNYWTLTANIQPGHKLYKPLNIAFSDKTCCFEQLGAIIPFFEDNCTTFDKNRFNIKIATEYTDEATCRASMRKDAQQVFYDMDSLYYFLQGGDTPCPSKKL